MFGLQAKMLTNPIICKKKKNVYNKLHETNSIRKLSTKQHQMEQFDQP